jgi:hypothetical protein
VRTGTNGELTDACETREAAIQKQENFCPFCDLSGQVVIYRRQSIKPECDGYTGKPTCRLVDHNGEERQVIAVMASHCRCEVGKWMRSRCDADVIKRIPPFAVVGAGPLKHWTAIDPTLPEYDSDEIPDWGAFRKQLASGKPLFTTVKPPRDVNRYPGVPAETKRLSAIEEARSLRPVEDNYGPAAVVAVPATDECPF